MVPSLAAEYVLIAGLLCIIGCTVMLVLVKTDLIQKINFKGKLI